MEALRSQARGEDTYEPFKPQNEKKISLRGNEEIPSNITRKGKRVLTTFSEIGVRRSSRKSILSKGSVRTYASKSEEKVKNKARQELFKKYLQNLISQKKQIKTRRNRMLSQPMKAFACRKSLNKLFNEDNPEQEQPSGKSIFVDAIMDSGISGTEAKKNGDSLATFQKTLKLRKNTIERKIILIF